MKTILSALIVLLVFVGLYLFFRPVYPVSLLTSASHVTPSDAVGYNLYTDENRGFTFAFPTNFQADEDLSTEASWSAGTATDGSVLAVVRVPRDYEPGTNLVDAQFTVGVSTEPSAISSCLSSPYADQGMPVPVTIGGVPFTRISYSGAAAGNRYDTTSYRAVHYDQCWAIEYTVHYGNIDNYPPGSIKQFDEQTVVTPLDEMAKSFRFLK